MKTLYKRPFYNDLTREQPFLIKTSDSFRIVTTNSIALLAILMGAHMNAYYSMLATVLYGAILAGLFLFIWFRKK